MLLTENKLEGKNVLFITTKNFDYIRNSQEIRLIRERSNAFDVIYSSNKNYILRILQVWNKITRKKIRDCDIVFLGFEPQFVLPFVGYKMKNKEIVIDCFISVYDTLVNDRKKIKAGGLMAKFCHWLDKKTISMANTIITDTKAHAEYFHSEFGGEKDRFETLYLEADESIYYPREQKKPEKLVDKYIVLYFGSILPLQGVDVVLDSLKNFENEKDIFFEIIGPVPKKYNKPEQANVCYYEWLSQNELSEHIAYADLCLAGHFSADIDKAWRTIPGKAYIYEMMGKKMILGDGAANHELFESDEKHSFVERGSSMALANEIRRIKSESFVYINGRC